MPSNIARSIHCCFAMLDDYFSDMSDLKRDRARCKLSQRPNDRRYAGWGSDTGREWLQVRCKRRAAAGTAELLPPALPPPVQNAFATMALAAASCLGALAEALGIPAERWLSLSDAHECSKRGASEGYAEKSAGLEDDDTDAASVMRLFRYVPSQAGGRGCHVHADLGLLTLSSSSSLVWEDNVGDAPTSMP